MLAAERRATTLLALLLFLRMLGLFLVLPVLSPWALQLAGEPGLAVGLAVGVYGLTQALLQVPLGWLSDVIGRKPVIAAGLLIFVAGSLLAAVAHSVETLVLGRLLQGCGAIAATSTALLADLLRESVRAIALAVSGIGIGMAFLLSLLLGPLLLPYAGVPGLFLLAALLGVLALGLLAALPRPPASVAAGAAVPAPGLPSGVAALVLAVGVLHALLAALFVVLPLELPAQAQWRTWLPAVLLSAVLVFPLLRWIETRGWQWRALAPAFAVLLLGLAGLSAVPHAGVWPTLALFFVAFNLLEASLPSLLTRLVGSARRGRVMGVFSSAQFFGVFAGSALAGWLYAHYGATATLLGVALLGLAPLLYLQRLPAQARRVAATSAGA